MVKPKQSTGTARELMRGPFCFFMGQNGEHSWNAEKGSLGPIDPASDFAVGERYLSG